MRYASNFKQPNKGEKALILRKCKALVRKFGNAHRAALKIGIAPKYMYSLLRAEKINPGDEILKKIGLRRVCYIEER